MSDGCCICVRQSDVAIIENCGRYDRLAAPGFHCIKCCCETQHTISLRLQELDVTFESKTMDNVFVKVVVTVQFQVLPGAIDVAFYSMENPRFQISAYVRHFLRAEIPSHSIEELYLERDQIATQLKVHVDEKMDSYGYDIIAALMTELTPLKQVRDSLDRIVALRRLEIAAVDGAAAETLKRIRMAEANAESIKLSAQGIANQRSAIVAGLQQSIDDFQHVCPRISKQDILSMLLVTQYLDMLVVSAKKPPSNGSGGDVLLMPNVSELPHLAADLMHQVIAARPSTERVQRAFRTGAMGTTNRSPAEEVNDDL